MSDVQIIEKDGKPEYAVIPFEQWERLCAAAEDADDARAYDETRAKAADQEPIPGDVVDRLLAGRNPVKVWREHRGLQQQALAEQIGVSKGYLSQIESGKKEGTVSLYRNLARALDVGLDELVGWREG
jgi:DNA-binding XRE family transcriptional regulator